MPNARGEKGGGLVGVRAVRTRLSQGPGRGPLGWLVVTGWLVVETLIALWSESGVVSDSRAGPFTLPVALFGCVAAGRVMRRRELPERIRRAWRWLTAGYVLLEVSTVVFAVTASFPGLADVLRLSVVPVLLVGVLHLSHAPRTRGGRARLALDIGVVVTAGFMILWYTSLGPLTRTEGLPLTMLTLAAAYPLADLVLLFGAAAALLRGVPPGSVLAVRCLVGGLCLIAAADLSYMAAGISVAMGRTSGSDEVSSTSFWCCLTSGYFLLLLAAVSQCAAPEAAEQRRATAGGATPAAVMPYLSIGLAYVLLLWVALRAGLYPWGGLVVGALVLTGLVVARQVLVLRENHTLLATDHLTGVLARGALGDHLERALVRSARTGQPLAVLLLDLDGFKKVNDTLGHEAGDELLKGFAAVLRAAAFERDAVGRIGGDEFAIVLAGVDSRTDAVAVAERVLAACRRPVLLADTAVEPRASLGIAMSRSGDTGRDVFRRADTAMYRAKGSGGGWAMAAEDEGDLTAVPAQSHVTDAVQPRLPAAHRAP